jgi:hypothetical protein
VRAKIKLPLWERVRGKKKASTESGSSHRVLYQYTQL